MSEFMQHVVTLDSAHMDVQPLRRTPLIDRYPPVLRSLDTYTREGFELALPLWIEQDWLNLDKPYYRVSPGMAEAFMKTRLDRVVLDDLHLPYEAMEVRLPDLPELRFADDEMRVSSVLLSIIAAEIAATPTEVHRREPYIGLICNIRNRANGRLEDQCYLLNRVPAFKTLEDVVRSFTPYEELPTQQMAAAYSIAVSTAFYATGYSELLQPELLKKDQTKLPSVDDSALAQLVAKARRRGIQGFYLSDERYDIRVGRKSSSGHYIAGNGDKRRFRFWRCGHWRRQRYGEGRSEVRIIWIRPVLCCPDLPPDPRQYGYVVAA